MPTTIVLQWQARKTSTRWESIPANLSWWPPLAPVSYTHLDVYKRQIAKLPSAQRKDSQGICFLGKINYNECLRRFLGEKEGDIIEMETGKRIGTHKGH